MPACYVWKCDCGIEWKTFHSDNKQKQIHVCMCKRSHEVTGVITHLFYSSNSQQPMDQTWDEVPKSRFKERLPHVSDFRQKSFVVSTQKDDEQPARPAKRPLTK